MMHNSGVVPPAHSSLMTISEETTYFLLLHMTEIIKSPGKGLHSFILSLHIHMSNNHNNITRLLPLSACHSKPARGCKSSKTDQRFSIPFGFSRVDSSCNSTNVAFMEMRNICRHLSDILQDTKNNLGYDDRIYLTPPPLHPKKKTPQNMYNMFL